MNDYTITLEHNTELAEYTSKTIIYNNNISHIIEITTNNDFSKVIHSVLNDYNKKGFRIKRDLYLYYDNCFNGENNTSLPLNIIFNGETVIIKNITNIEDYKEYGWTDMKISLELAKGLKTEFIIGLRF